MRPSSLVCPVFLCLFTVWFSSDAIAQTDPVKFEASLSVQGVPVTDVDVVINDAAGQSWPWSGSCENLLLFNYLIPVFRCVIR